MTAREFCYWLQGRFELSADNNFTSGQVEAVRRHLASVPAGDIAAGKLEADGGLYWTKKKPTEDGDYWCRKCKYGANFLCEVRGGIVRRAFSLHDEFVNLVDWEWWGPLRGPDTAADGKGYDCRDVKTEEATR